MLWVRDPELFERAQVIREKGTNRSAFRIGKVDRYHWVDTGSSYLMAEINAAYLWPQLTALGEITRKRRTICDAYRNAFKELILAGRVEVQEIPTDTDAPGHIFYLKLQNEAHRNAFVATAASRGILAVSHYVPLHTSPAGRRYGRFVGNDLVTTRDSNRLVRLPVFYNMTDEQQRAVIECVLLFFGANP